MFCFVSPVGWFVFVWKIFRWEQRNSLSVRKVCRLQLKIRRWPNQTCIRQTTNNTIFCFFCFICNLSWLCHQKMVWFMFKQDYSSWFVWTQPQFCLLFVFFVCFFQWNGICPDHHLRLCSSDHRQHYDWLWLDVRLALDTALRLVDTGLLIVDRHTHHLQLESQPWGQGGLTGGEREREVKWETIVTYLHSLLGGSRLHFGLNVESHSRMISVTFLLYYLWMKWVLQ